MHRTFISICIPAYKRPDFLKRLLNSIVVQEFSDFEVIVTDDSPSQEVKSLCDEYRDRCRIVYHRNINQLGTPENWNQAIRLAKGEWIKLMHDDDWFTGSGSLGTFAAAAKGQGAHFIFSGYYNVFSDGRKRRYSMGKWHTYLLNRSPVNLVHRNFIGHPSTTLIKNELGEWYDKRFKWVVDLEFYIRVLSADRKYFVIKAPLVNLGIGNEQVTHSVFRNPEVEIPENIELLKKVTVSNLRRILVYDYFWRFIRNLSIGGMEVVQKFYGHADVPPLLQCMISQQSKIPQALIRIGVFSKLTMIVTYVWNLMKNRMK